MDANEIIIEKMQRHRMPMVGEFFENAFPGVNCHNWLAHYPIKARHAEPLRQASAS